MAKQFDNIEDRFREAADRISFPPNEEAWRRMETLLDKEKEHRPVVFWWYLLLFGVLVGGAFTYFLAGRKTSITENALRTAQVERVSKPSANTAARTESPQNARAENPGSEVKTKAGDSKEDDALTPGNLAPSTGSKSASETQSSDPGLTSGKNNLADASGLKRSSTRNDDGTRQIMRTRSLAMGGAAKATTQKLPKAREKSLAPSQSANQSRNSRGQSSGTAKDGTNNRRKQTESVVRERGADAQDSNQERISSDLTNSAASGTAKAADSMNSSSSQMVKADSSASAASAKKDIPAAPQKDSPVTPKSAIKIPGSSAKWQLQPGINLSFGARVDATSLHKISLHQFTQIYGGTIGYRFSNRLSVYTGLFVQKAIYFAGPEDYSVKAGSYLSMYRISKIDAVCTIYDIPLNLRYDAVVGRSMRLFTSAGLNSFYLKKENYRYHAMGSSGYRMFDSSYHANRDVFSSVFLSIGMEKKLSKSFSVQAEPYLKLPLSGIGEGSVKLFSAGAQLSLRYQPQFIKSPSGKK